LRARLSPQKSERSHFNFIVEMSIIFLFGYALAATHRARDFFNSLRRLILKKLLPLFALSSTLLLSACANDYRQFYKPMNPDRLALVASRRVSPPPAEPIVERSQPGDPKTILDAYAKRGYVLIGSSMFNSGRAPSEAAAVQQGKGVGADLVLIFNPRYTGSVTSTVPIVTPTSSTSYSTGTATAFGPRGAVTAFGSGTTTTYGTQTNFIPMTVNRSNYGAAYFVKQRFDLGAFTRDLNDSERHQFQTNKGVIVTSIVDGTPAFDADILVGDRIISVDGVEISNGQSFFSTLKPKAGQKVTLAIARDGKQIDKSVQLGR
jgi:hypothetical protein